jgi:hypothetical protein
MKAILHLCLLLAIGKLALGHVVAAYYNAAAPGYFPPQRWKFNPTNTIALDNWNHLHIMRAAADRVTDGVNQDFAQRVNSAIALLAKNQFLTNTVTIGCLDFVNPFPLLLNAPQPRGEPVWNDLHNTFDEQRFIPPDEYFAGCPVVLVPTASNSRETVAALLAIYNDYLYAHYSLIDQNASWYLVKRK